EALSRRSAARVVAPGALVAYCARPWRRAGRRRRACRSPCSARPATRAWSCCACSRGIPPSSSPSSPRSSTATGAPRTSTPSSPGSWKRRCGRPSLRRSRSGLLRGAVVIDAKSGSTGAGRGVKVDQLFAEVNENFRPYAIGEHRHGPEIDQELRAAGAVRGALFVPHLLPLSRGLLCTMYVRTGGARPRLAELFQGAYDGQPFVVLRGEDAPPELRDVRGTTRCAS